jgi:NTP pyrophosphatase (non-canonical NTP hydrolase)
MNTTLLQEAIKTFGIENQILKTIEELGELQSELARYLLYQKHNETLLHKVSEEIADVAILLEQLKLVFPNTNAISKKKLERLKVYIEQHKKGEPYSHGKIT